jgi:hypothetical protein
MTEPGHIDLTAPRVASSGLPALAEPTAFDEALLRRTRWRWLMFAIVPVALLYLLLQNDYWVPGGDSEVYLAIARNLVHGKGYTYNGEPVAMIPPGWPIVLAGLMLIWPTFAFIKTAMMIFMLGSLVLAYFVLLRLMSPKLAALSVLLAGILHPLYPLTLWTHSESLFCLLAWASLLLACRVAEGKCGWFGVGSMVLLTSAAAFVRWTGLIQVVLILSVLLSHGRWRGVGGWRPVIAAGCALSFTCLTFLVTYQTLKLTPDELSRARAVGGAMDREDATVEMHPTTFPINAEASVVRVVDTSGSGTRSLTSEYANRLGNAGKWYAWLFWYPFRFGQSVKLVSHVGLVLGWVCILLLTIAMVVRVGKGEWIWVALALYTGALTMNWPNPNARYFVPVAPLLLGGVLVALHAIHQGSRRRLGRIVAYGGGGAFVVSVAACNLALAGIDVSVMRSPEFYRYYEAGVHQSLIEACRYLNQLDPPPKNGEIGVSERYVNLGRSRFSKAGVRSVVLLTNRVVRPVPPRLSKPPGGGLTAWASRGTIVRTPYYLYQLPSSPWRVWHFRLSPKLQERLTGLPPEPPSGGWVLYQLRRTESRWKKLDVPTTSFEFLKRVPGL